MTFDYEKLWGHLRSEVLDCVQEGYQNGFQNFPNTSEGGRLSAYRYVCDLISRLECNPDFQIK